jgi:putative CocE/NonD family hydrolase
VDREPAVRAFLMGENTWREGDTWPLPGTSSRALYLSGAPTAAGNGTVPVTGRLGGSEPAAEGGTTAFESDPARPVEDPFASDAGAHDYRALAARTDVAVFETAPFRQDTRVLGAIRAELFVSTDAPDIDLWVKLFDVAPDGTAYNLMSPGLDVLRASSRAGGAREMLRPSEVYALRFENLMTGNTFLEGHRLRLLVCGSFFPHFSRNLQTGALEMSSAETRPARVQVHHSRAHASRLVLPVLDLPADRPRVQRD